MKKFCLILSVCFLFAGCSEKEEAPDKSSPYADIQEGFMAQEPRTTHTPKYTPNDYFYKHCDQHMDASYFSKTSYMCNDH